MPCAASGPAARLRARHATSTVFMATPASSAIPTRAGDKAEANWDHRRGGKRSHHGQKLAAPYSSASATVTTVLLEPAVRPTSPIASMAKPPPSRWPAGPRLPPMAAGTGQQAARAPAVDEHAGHKGGADGGCGIDRHAQGEPACRPALGGRKGALVEEHRREHEARGQHGWQQQGELSRSRTGPRGAAAPWRPRRNGRSGAR